ncbi:hypothetical protein [Tumidithrix helvetica]|uniref:hypothetical protein n=1 Tax=Tumidithrix helvetica TaxID=3457545 RepID=UPI003CC5549F
MRAINSESSQIVDELPSSQQFCGRIQSWLSDAEASVGALIYGQSLSPVRSEQMVYFFWLRFYEYVVNLCNFPSTVSR